MNAILGDGPRKTRDDHRHHAVDAVAIALTEPAIVKKLSDAAKRARQEKRRCFAPIQRPWPDFGDSVRESIDQIVVSRRVSRKVSGALHEETIYSRPITDRQGKPHYHARKALNDKFGPKAVASIVDPVVRKRVRAHLKKHGNDPKKAFSDAKKMPCMVSSRVPGYLSLLTIASLLPTNTRRWRKSGFPREHPVLCTTRPGWGHRSLVKALSLLFQGR